MEILIIGRTIVNCTQKKHYGAKFDAKSKWSRKSQAG